MWGFFLSMASSTWYLLHSGGQPLPTRPPLLQGHRLSHKPPRVTWIAQEWLLVTWFIFNAWKIKHTSLYIQVLLGFTNEFFKKKGFTVIYTKFILMFLHPEKRKKSQIKCGLDPPQKIWDIFEMLSQSESPHHHDAVTMLVAGPSCCGISAPPCMNGSSTGFKNLNNI